MPVFGDASRTPQRIGHAGHHLAANYALNVCSTATRNGTECLFMPLRVRTTRGARACAWPSWTINAFPRPPGSPVGARRAAARSSRSAGRSAFYDHWWEPETECHRQWKLRFPDPWQENIYHDPNGEKHIADIRTMEGLIIEFQHSHICPDERATRERFYGAMIWVVNGRRMQRDLPRFQVGACDLRRVAVNGVYLHRFPNELFPTSLRLRNHCAHSRRPLVTVPALVDQWLTAERASQVRRLTRYRPQPTRPDRRWKPYNRRKRKFIF